MNYQSFISIFFLFILTINYSLTLSYFDPTNGIIKNNNNFFCLLITYLFLDELNQSDGNDLQKVIVLQIFYFN